MELIRGCSEDWLFSRFHSQCDYSIPHWWSEVFMKPETCDDALGNSESSISLVYWDWMGRFCCKAMQPMHAVSYKYNLG